MKRYIDKKTGEKKAFGNLQVYAEAENTNESQFLGNFDSFKQILEYYEDYIPKEPIIKDKEIISLLRPWIKYNEIEKAIILKVADCWFHIKGKDSSDCWWDIEIHASYSESVDKDYHGELVGSEELCGSEEDE